MAIQLKFDLQPVERYVENTVSTFATDVKDFISSLTNRETLTNIAQSLIQTGVNLGLDFVERELSSLFSEYLSSYDRKLSSLIRKLNTIIPFPSFDQYFNLSQGECPENPFLEFDPYIQGAFFVFIYFPDFLTQQSRINLSNLCGFLAKGYTVPTLQVQTVERKGFGNSSLTLPSTKDYEKTITITFYDTYNLVIQDIFEAWLNGIIDMRSGFHKYSQLSDIKGTITLISYTPTMKQQVNVKTFLGAFPTSVPLVEQSRENVNLREVQITFAYDTI